MGRGLCIAASGMPTEQVRRDVELMAAQRGIRSIASQIKQ